jgi:hypothetical protein
VEEDEAREDSASSFPSIAPIGSSLQQHAAMGWKQQQQQQQYLHQQHHQQEGAHSASADDRWGAGVDSPSMKHHFQKSNNNHNYISNDTTSGWSDQRDTSQHSRGSIWTDDHSRSSHTSAGTGTTNFTGNYSSQSTHPFASAGTAEASATSGISHRHDDPLLGNLARLSLAGGNDPSQQSYYNAMSVGPPPRQQPQPHAPAPRNPFYTSSVAATQHNHISSSSSVMSVESSIPGLMGAGSGSTGGTAISQYGWNPQQQQQQARKPPHVQSSLAAAAAATTTILMPPPGFRQPSAEAGGGGSDSHSLGSRSYHSASANTDNESVTSNSERSRGKRGGRGGGRGRGSSYREKQPQQRQQHNHHGREGRGRGSGRGSSDSNSMPPPPFREYNHSSGAAAAGNIAAAAGNVKANAHATTGNDSSMYNAEHSFALSSSSLNRAAGAWSGAATADAENMGSSEAIRQLMKPAAASSYLNHTGSISTTSSLQPSVLEMDGSYLHTAGTANSRTADSHPILPQALQVNDDSFGHTMPSDDEEDDDDEDDGHNPFTQGAGGSPKSKEKKWLLRMNRKLAEIPVGELDPATMPLSAVMNTWAKTKSSQGASMVEMWLKRAQQEYDAGNHRVEPTAKMYTMAGT